MSSRAISSLIPPTRAARRGQTGVPTANRPDRIRDHVRARVWAVTLDRELASGVPEDTTAALTLRARALSGAQLRAELGAQLREIVKLAHEPARPSTRVPLAREHVLETEDELRRLASRLQSPSAVQARGVAKVRLLLTDGTGPLFLGRSSAELGTAVRDAIAALGLTPAHAEPIRS